MLLLLAWLLLLAVGPWPPAGADTTPGPAVPPAGRPLFGPGLDWAEDSAAAYQERLGLAPSLYEQRVAYPLDPESTTFLEQMVEQVAPQGAVALLSLEPSVALGDLDQADAAALAETLSRLHAEHGTTFLLRFAPEMNGTWYSWGQQPRAYVSAFRELAGVVHASAPEARLVWSPVYGAGYPYGAAYGDVDPDRTRDVTALDTDADGRLDGDDDPYGPYWPGAEAVDWVGLTLFHFGIDRGREDNALDPSSGGTPGEDERSIGFETDVAPRAGAFRARMVEQFGYDGTRRREPFYERFAEAYERPLLVETGAVWLPDAAGDPELRIKRAWWRQVLAADEEYPLLRGISWLEQRRPEAEVQGRTVDWRATRLPRLATAFAEDLTGEVTLGPVTSAPTGDQPGAAAERDGDIAPAVRPDPAAGGLVAAWWALTVMLLLALLVSRLRPGWSWPGHDAPDTTGRDERLDVLRGILLVVLVAAHLEALTATSGPVSRLMGVTTGPEAFVLLSGVVLAMGHGPLVARVGALSAAGRWWRRGAALWFTAVATTLVVLGVSYLPGARTSGVTTWAATGAGVDLYTGAASLLEYPPPWPAVRDLFLLGTGPWPLAMLGLLVVLSLAAPAVLWLLGRGLWWLALLLSWGLFTWGTVTAPDWTVGQYESAYPPLVWQVVFVHGLVLGHHRTVLARAWASPAGRAGFLASVVALATALTVAWTAPGGPALLLHLWGGDALGAGRLLSVLLVGLVAVAVLSAAWTPVRRGVARVLVPVGRAGLLVLVLHVLLLVVVDTVATGTGTTAPGAWWATVVLPTVALVLLVVLAPGLVRRTVAR
ncbi:OpgC domain-containing protein [Nocardioides sp. 31GB23]|uniref:OpgC domain-containing protein n=1 Tax=Nocardioides sp. 31GB23 TaxID=3156065 RepID=UPI0032B01755